MLKYDRKAKTPLEDRLRKFAEDARAAASRAQPGLERDRLINKAKKAETLATAAERLLYSDAAFANVVMGTKCSTHD